MDSEIVYKMYDQIKAGKHVVIEVPDNSLVYYLYPSEVNPEITFGAHVLGIGNPFGVSIAYTEFNFYSALLHGFEEGNSPYIYPNEEEARGHLKRIGFIKEVPKLQETDRTSLLENAYKQEHKTPYPEEPDTEDMQCDECDCDIFTALINSATKELYALECQGCGHLNLLVNLKGE